MPVYPTTFKLSQNTLRKIISNGLKEVNDKLPETLPDYLIKEYKLQGLNEAIAQIHNPSEFDEMKKARYRLVFEELLSVQLALLELKYNYMNEINRNSV